MNKWERVTKGQTDRPSKWKDRTNVCKSLNDCDWLLSQTATATSQLLLVLLLGAFLAFLSAWLLQKTPGANLPYLETDATFFSLQHFSVCLPAIRLEQIVYFKLKCSVVVFEAISHRRDMRNQIKMFLYCIMTDPADVKTSRFDTREVKCTSQRCHSWLCTGLRKRSQRGRGDLKIGSRETSNF